ncbi:MAG: type VI secretion system baseplate subunit TssF [Planctomycetales bacterium]|nr:type VI secretion system baseplate subunit TssF [Planctomycetales bacterium]
MSDELLPYYNRELAYFRRMSREFAERHPKIAGRLKLSGDTSSDPHVERLIEAFAFLNARTRHKIDDDFPEISDSLLNSLYPHYLTPIPSAAIVQIYPDESATNLQSLSAETELVTESVEGEPCRFRTVYPVQLWPLKLSRASLTRQPAAAPETARSGAAVAVLRWELVTQNEVTVAELSPGRLRVFIKAAPQNAFHLYELLLNNVLEIAVARSASDPDPIVLPRTAVSPVGFAEDEGMLPYPARSSLAFRQLSEFFAYPDKFLFIDLDLAAVPGAAARAKRESADPTRWQQFGQHLNIYFYLDRTSMDLEQNVSAETFRLGCSPIVNLFRQRAEPINTDGAAYEYRVEPDARRPLAIEVYSVDHVYATDADGREQEMAPLYSIRHGYDSERAQGYWHVARRPTAGDSGSGDPGTDIYLSLVRQGAELFDEANLFIDVEATCFNRNIPNRLPFGGGQPRLTLVDGGSFRIDCLTQPSPTRRPPRRHAAVWRLISHLSLGHLPLEGGPDGAAALREVLSLYDLNPHGETKTIFEAIRHVETRPSVSRISGGICRGVEVRVTFHAKQFSENGLFLFSAVLDRYLALHCTLNSFTQLTVLIQGWDKPLVTWPARAGGKVIA